MWVLLSLLLPNAALADATCFDEARPPVVAIIDTGADTDHPLLRNGLWTNVGETGIDRNGMDKASNGIDDDGNGFVDDVHGWNFLRNSADLTDKTGHGTHIAGLIRTFAVGQPLHSEASAASLTATLAAKEDPMGRLMILKYYDPGALPLRTVSAFQQAFQYALKMGATIIHVSGGGYGRRSSEEDLIAQAEKQGVIVVAASGNKTAETADRPFYPASYEYKNVFPIAATDARGDMLRTTNKVPGRKYFLERGAEVLSSLPGRRYGLLTGTSQAAGVFTGKLLAKLRPLCVPPSTSLVALLQNF